MGEFGNQETGGIDNFTKRDSHSSEAPSAATSFPPFPVSYVPVPLLTPARSVSWEGAGLHTGEPSTVTVYPSEEPGLIFEVEGVSIPALADYVSDTARCTVLSNDGATIATVEHLLASLAGLGIWSARIQVTGREIPILDGSAGPFVDALLKAGIRSIGEIDAIIPGEGEIQEGEAVRSWSPPEIHPEASFLLSGGHPLLSGQCATIPLNDSASFAHEIAPCRTWAPYEQVQPLIERGLIRGGSLENAVVVYPDRYSSPLRREAEPARHKLLDLIGDLALAGRPLHARIAAEGGGHTLNIQLARLFREADQLSRSI